MKKMEGIVVKHVEEAAAGCRCGLHQPITIEQIVIKADIFGELEKFIRSRRSQPILMVADENTFTAAGNKLEQQLLRCGYEVRKCLLSPPSKNGEGVNVNVIADEQTLMQLFLAANADDLLLAVGSGTIHDIVRFVSYKLGCDFVSIPTAPSVDGFTSKGAPLIVQGKKTTVPACAPVAVFADLNVLENAPFPMIAAGFGDMLGKYTSLFDWKFGHAIGEEPFCQAAFSLTMEALQLCCKHLDEIAKCSTIGVRVLIRALLQSGLAMLLFGHSHPASGAEHHVSHFWEMDYLRQGKPQLLHGAKVAVACVEISKLYHHIVNHQDRVNDRSIRPFLHTWLGMVPQPDELQSMIRQMGAPATPNELGISEELLQRSLKEAYRLRMNRMTLMRFFNEEINDSPS